MNIIETIHFFKAGFSRSIGPFFNKSRFINLRFAYNLKIF